jgi:hypothetical protein
VDEKCFITNEVFRAFVWEQTWRFVALVALFEAIGVYIKTTPQASLPTPKSLYNEPWPQQVLLAWLQAIRAWSSMKFLYHSMAIVAVGAGLSEPRDWPPIYGTWSDAYTVRQFWGRVWHQWLRRIFTVYSDVLVVDVLGLKKGSFWSKYAQLFSAFFLSGFVHCYPGIVLAGNDVGSWWFFMSQAVVILVEDHVLDASKAMGLRRNAFWQGLGYLYVFAWLSFSLRFYMAGLISIGMWLLPR